MKENGFYQIRTFECLARGFSSKAVGYKRIVREVDDKEEEEGKTENESKGWSKRKKKEHEKEKRVMCAPDKRIRGHTGFLSFATLGT